MDDLRKKTDKELQKMEKKLAKIYKEAEKDLTKKWDEYMGQAAAELAPLEKAYVEAKESGDEDLKRQTGFKLAEEKRKQTIQNNYYQKMIEQTAEKYSDVNNIAVAYVNDKMPGIYTMNLNGTLQDINSDLGRVGQLGVSFNLVDEHTVKNLVKSDKSLFPQKVINKAKDMKWNLKAINSQVTQGILQGESIPQIQKRLQNVTSMNSAAAIRSARTMCTTAENNGRLSGIKEAEEQGIVYEKQWMATHDERTRESHAELDGESVPIDEEFSNGLQYPGDPAGAPEEVYNCRCSMVRKLIGFRREDGSVSEVGDIKSYEPHYFDKPQEEEAKESEKEQKIEESKVEESKEEADSDAIEVGNTFNHAKFGKGTITDIDGDIVTIDFDGQQKRISSAFLENVRAPKEEKAETKVDVSKLSTDVRWEYQYTESQGYTQSELKDEYNKYKDVMYKMTPDQRYDLAKEMTKEIPTENNFFKNSVGFWKKAEDRTEEPNHISYNKRNGKISSEYWYTTEGVYRRSDHWGSDVASCSWYIEGREYSNYGVELGERETAFIPWEELKAKGVIHYDEGVYTLNEYEHNFTFQ